MKPRRFILMTLASFPVAVTINDVFGFVSIVKGSSMQPTLNPGDGNKKDWVFQSRWAIRHYKFNRGEVVSFTNPRNPDEKFIKRIVALEGDTVKTLSYKNRYVKVPTGHCWLEGDNHSRSLDSNMFGPVALGLIFAKATHVVWPPSRWQRIPTILPHTDRLNCERPPPPGHALSNDQLIDELMDLSIDIKPTKVVTITRRPQSPVTDR